MKKTAILGMVLATTMSFSALAAHPAKMLERAAESKAKIEESLYGKDKEGKVITYKSLGEAGQRSAQDRLLAKLPITGKDAGLRDYLREDGAKSNERMSLILDLVARKTYGESLGTAEGKALADVSTASLKLLSNATRAKDRNDEATLELVKQIEQGQIDSWKPTQMSNIAKILEAQDRHMEQGLDSNSALVKAYQEVKGVSEAEAKAAVKKIKELC
ncbi:hypothetical protein [Bdellovibrio sp. HCB2-146]|uniref:hypothetical protein n=1 Tax=Bdellovibrio sp. HCB2-146 TaxID=3394362 RepID=UPI0039BC7A7C